LAQYHLAHLPLDGYFWPQYLKSPEPGAFLKETAREVADHRRGKPLASLDEKELHLAYASLDNPEELSYEQFAKRIMAVRKRPLPPLFLPSSFTASVPETRSLHHRVDKGKILQALEPVGAVKDADTFRAYFKDFFVRSHGALRNIKEDLLAEFPKGFEGLKLAEILEGLKVLIPRIYPKANNPKVQDLVARLSLMLAWHRAGIESLKERMEAIRGAKIPSDTVWEGLKATEEFYRDTLGDVFRELKVDGDQILFIRKQKRLLAAELGRAKQEGQEKVEVEFIPSKSQADRFLAWRIALRQRESIHRKISGLPDDCQWEGLGNALSAEGKAGWEKGLGDGDSAPVLLGGRSKGLAEGDRGESFSNRSGRRLRLPPINGSWRPAIQPPGYAQGDSREGLSFN
jgi:hypothetical protein